MYKELEKRRYDFIKIRTQIVDKADFVDEINYIYVYIKTMTYKQEFVKLYCRFGMRLSNYAMISK